jgi:hypothetical protein
MIAFSGHVRTASLAAAALNGSCNAFRPGSSTEGRLTVARPESVLLAQLKQMHLFAATARGDLCAKYVIITGDPSPDPRNCSAAIEKAVSTQASSSRSAAAALARADARFDAKPPADANRVDWLEKEKEIRQLEASLATPARARRAAAMTMRRTRPRLAVVSGRVAICSTGRK